MNGYMDMYQASQPSNTVISSPPGSSLLVIDSEDRNVASAVNVSSASLVEYQPWNNFRIQTPDRLAVGAVRRIMPKSIRFPWFIPNLNPQNDNMNIVVGGTSYYIDLGAGGSDFYTPQEIATLINNELAGDGVGLAVEWMPGSQRYQWTATDLSGTTIRFQATNSPIAGLHVPLTNEQFVSLPSLCKTMGFNLASLSTTYVPDSADFAFNPCSATECLYTRYVDIVSPRLLQYRKMIDGASKNANKKALITRVYCANETSMNTYDISGNAIPIGTQPFIIHRKLNEKDIRWEPEATIDYIDFQLYDEYGNLVQLPVVEFEPSTFPSFQMTFNLSEC